MDLRFNIVFAEVGGEALPRAERRGLGMEKERERRREDERGGKKRREERELGGRGGKGKATRGAQGRKAEGEGRRGRARETMGLPKDPTGRGRPTSDTASKILRDEPTFA